MKNEGKNESMSPRFYLPPNVYGVCQVLTCIISLTLRRITGASYISFKLCRSGSLGSCKKHAKSLLRLGIIEWIGRGFMKMDVLYVLIEWEYACMWVAQDSSVATEM